MVALADAGSRLAVSRPAEPRPRVVRVLPDEPAINKEFDYLVPESLGEEVRLGTRVRIGLHGRRVGGWVVGDPVEPLPGVTLSPLAKVTGWGPPPDIIELAYWAAQRWAGRPAQLLRTATAEASVRSLPRPGARAAPIPDSRDAHADLVAEAFVHSEAVLRLPPAADLYPAALAAASLGNALILAPSVDGARRLGLRLRRAGLPVAILPRDWALARAGAVVVGSRAAAWAPVKDLAAVVLFDEHDESWQQEQAPTWHARDVVIERARRAGVPCVLVSAAPSLEALSWGRLVAPSRAVERDGWPAVDLVDRRGDEPGRGMFSDPLVAALRSGARVVCVLNRTGRSRLVACVACGETGRCERCDSAVAVTRDRLFECRRCGAGRPPTCLGCGATAFKNLRAGVTRVREELEALARTPVVEVKGAEGHRGDHHGDERGDVRERGRGGSAIPAARIHIGTEAVLHHIDSAEVVAYLDFDQELLGPRYRAGEEALALLVRGARLVGGRRGGGRLIVQTRLPHHEVLQAALLGDPARLTAPEAERRALLRLPPAAAIATVSGAAAPAYVQRLEATIADLPAGVEVLGPSDGQWLVRAPDHEALLAALNGTDRPSGRVRVAVDPMRL